MAKEYFWYRGTRYLINKRNCIRVPVGDKWETIYVGPPYPKLGKARDIGEAIRKLQRAELESYCRHGKAVLREVPRIQLTSIARLTRYDTLHPFPMVGDPEVGRDRDKETVLYEHAMAAKKKLTGCAVKSKQEFAGDHARATSRLVPG